MADVSVPAKVTITSDVDPSGLEIVEAQLEVDPASMELDLPAGDAGPKGVRGVPRATWIKQGEIANAAARPSGLTADDRGKWWHRLDTNGMDTWDGSQWIHSAGAVGPQGPAAPNNVITSVETIRDPKFTLAGARFSGYNEEQELKVTIPAGPKGVKGDPGESGVIRESPDFDQRFAPTNNGLFGWNRGPKKFRPLPFPCGYGPWAIDQNSFPATATYDAQETTLASIEIPALPFRYRPFCYGTLMMLKRQKDVWPHVWVRLGSPNGNPVAHGVLSFRVIDVNFYEQIIPNFGENRVSPTSSYGVVEPYTPTTLYVVIERQGNSSGTIGHNQAGASLAVYAMPV